MTTQTSQPTIGVTELVNVLEPLIRRIVREELMQFAAEEQEIFALPPDSPLYADLAEILRRKEQGEIKLYSQAEVWDE